MKQSLQEKLRVGAIRVSGSVLVFGLLALFGGGAAQAATEENILLAPAYRGGPDVRVYQENGTLVKSFMAYAPNIRASYQVEWGDVDGDGTNEIITMPSDGARHQIRIFRQDGTVVGQFFAEGFPHQRTQFLLADFDGDHKVEFAYRNGDYRGIVSVFQFLGIPWQVTGSISTIDVYGENYRGGINMAAGDVDGDGDAELMIAPASGHQNGPNVRVYQYNAAKDDMELLTGFWGEDEDYRGGLSVAAGDWDGDGNDEIFTTIGEDKERGRATTIFLHDWNASTKKMETVTAVDGPYNTKAGVENNTLNYRELLGRGGAGPALFRNNTRGLNLFSGDVDGNGTDDLLMVPTYGSHIRAYTHTSGGTIGAASLMDWGHAYGEKSSDALYMSLTDVDGDGDDELVTLPGPWAKSHVKVWRWDTSTQKRSLIGSFFGYPSFRWGAYVAQ
jgi:hypothetical protein